MITFCVSCCNNLNYLKLAVHSVRTYSHFKDAEFIVFAENCDKDDTYKWLEENKDKYKLTVFIENNSVETTKGIGGGMNLCASHVKTEYIMFLHADFFVSKNWDLECLKLFEKYPNTPLWVSSQRFQPNIWKQNNRPGTIMFPYEDFGYKHDNFDEDYFIQYAEEFSKLNNDIEIEKGEGVSGLIRKKDWDYIGGNDPIYQPAFWEDIDLFIRMQLANYKFIMTTNSIVFHFGSRSDKSNFPNDEIVRAETAKNYEKIGAQKFYKKWGFFPSLTNTSFSTYPSNINKEKYNHLIKL